MARILVLDGHSSAALAFTRSAGQAGHWVAVGANRGLFASAKLSRYCKLVLDYPVSTQDPSEFVNSLVDFARAQSIDLIIPVTDWTLQPLSEQRGRFEGICRVALPPRNAVLTASDKYQAMEFAKKQGIRVPCTRMIRSASDLASLGEMKLPLVVKDRFSVRWTEGGAVFGSVSYAFTNEELRSIVQHRLQLAGDVLVQEFVSGEGIGVSLFITEEDIFLPFQWQRVREVDPRGSASSARKSITLDQNLMNMSYRLVGSIGFRGIVMVEYKRAADGSMIFMEINGRPWGSIGLAVASGIDYPRHYIDWCLDGKLPPQRLAYKVNVTCRKLIGEMTHLTNVRRGKPQNWPGDYPEFWSTLLKVAIPWYPGMHYDDLWISDPRPTLSQIKNWFQVRRKS